MLWKEEKLYKNVFIDKQYKIISELVKVSYFSEGVVENIIQRFTVICRSVGFTDGIVRWSVRAGGRRVGVNDGVRWRLLCVCQNVSSTTASYARR